MGFDIRVPIGGLFSVLGLLLCAYGASTRGSTMYSAHSLGLNVNLGWGLVMLLFGLAMLGLTRFARTDARDAKKSTKAASHHRHLEH